MESQDALDFLFGTVINCDWVVFCGIEGTLGTFGALVFLGVMLTQPRLCKLCGGGCTRMFLQPGSVINVTITESLANPW